jgi:hypothetical protein
MLAIGFSAYALWRLRTDRERRGVWYAVVAASVLYLLVSRLPFLRPYAYGYLKSLSLVSYVLLGVLAQGIVFAWQAAGARQPRVRYAAAGALAVLFAATAFTFGITLEQYFKPTPMFFNEDALKVRELGALVQDESQDAPVTVLLSDRPEVQVIPMGLAAYALREVPLYGNVKTGYGGLENVLPNAVYDYALLGRGEEPTVRGYQPRAVWQNEKFALYPRRTGALVHQFLDEFHSPAQELVLLIDEDGLSAKGHAAKGDPAERALTVGLVLAEPGSVTLRAGEHAKTLDLEPGLASYTFPFVDLPATLTITPHNTTELYVPYIELRRTNATPEGVEPSDATIVRCLGNQEDPGAVCRVVNPTGRVLNWKWVVRGKIADSHEEQELVVVSALASPKRRVRAIVNGSGAFQKFQFDDDPPLELAQEALPDGTWRADMEVWDGDKLMARFPVNPLIKISGAERRWEHDSLLPPAILAP